MVEKWYNVQAFRQKEKHQAVVKIEQLTEVVKNYTDLLNIIQDLEQRVKIEKAPPFMLLEPKSAEDVHDSGPASSNQWMKQVRTLNSSCAGIKKRSRPVKTRPPKRARLMVPDIAKTLKPNAETVQSQDAGIKRTLNDKKSNQLNSGNATSVVSVPRPKMNSGFYNPQIKGVPLSSELLERCKGVQFGLRCNTGWMTVVDIDNQTYGDKQFLYVVVASPIVPDAELRVRVQIPVPTSFPQDGLIIGNRIRSYNSKLSTHVVGKWTLSIRDATFSVDTEHINYKGIYKDDINMLNAGF